MVEFIFDIEILNIIYFSFSSLKKFDYKYTCFSKHSQHFFTKIFDFAKFYFTVP